MSEDRHSGTPAYQDTTVDARAAEADSGEVAPDTVGPDTRHDVPTHQVEYHESVLEDGHTRKVDVRPQGGGTNLSVHDREETRSSREMAKESQKARRRERDKRAEKAAQRMVLGIAALATFAFVGLFWEDIFAPPPTSTPQKVDAHTKAKSKGTTKTTPPQGSADGALRRDARSPRARLLGRRRSDRGRPRGSRRSCCSAIHRRRKRSRFKRAGSPTECGSFRPNKAFRFLTTCPVLEGEVLVGAYEVSKATVFMSPIRSGNAQFTSRFEVQKPAQLITEVLVGGRRLLVRQKATAIRPGMDGDAFVRSFAGSNTLTPKGAVPPPAPRGPSAPGPAPAPAPSKGKKDPLLDLLKGQ